MTNLDLTNQQMSAQMVHSIHNNFDKIIVINLNELVHCLCLTTARNVAQENLIENYLKSAKSTKF